MPKHYVSFPSGFRTPVGPDDVTANDGDVQITALHKVYADGMTVSQTWEFKSEVLECAKRLIPNLKEFLLANRGNANISYTAYEFLNDSVKFIETGRRDINCTTHIELVKLEQESITEVKKPIKSTRPDISYTLPNQRYLTYWARRPGGIEDILCTLNYIFGTNSHA